MIYIIGFSPSITPSLLIRDYERGDLEFFNCSGKTKVRIFIIGNYGLLDTLFILRKHHLEWL